MSSIVHTINNWHREDRLLQIAKQAKEQKFALKIWDGIINDKAQVFSNISRAHKQIVRDAKEKRFKTVTICEDDVCFSHENAFDYYISQMPRNYSLFLGMIYSGEIKDNRIIEGFSGLSLYTVHHDFYDYFLSADEEDHLDRWLGRSALEHQYIVCNPYVCYQSGGYSDNKRQVMSYQVFHDNMTFYNG